MNLRFLIHIYSEPFKIVVCSDMFCTVIGQLKIYSIASPIALSYLGLANAL